MTRIKATRGMTIFAMSDPIVSGAALLEEAVGLEDNAVVEPVVPLDDNGAVVVEDTELVVVVVEGIAAVDVLAVLERGSEPDSPIDVAAAVVIV